MTWRMPAHRRRIVIVGGGFSGVALTVQLLRPERATGS